MSEPNDTSKSKLDMSLDQLRASRAPSESKHQSKRMGGALGTSREQLNDSKSRNKFGGKSNNNSQSGNRGNFRKPHKRFPESGTREHGRQHTDNRNRNRGQQQPSILSRLGGRVDERRERNNYSGRRNGRGSYSNRSQDRNQTRQGRYANQGKRNFHIDANSSKPSIASRLRAEWNEYRTQVSFFLLPSHTKAGEDPAASSTSLLVVPESGHFIVLCQGNERNFETAQAINIILRPFNIKVAPALAGDYSSDWYLTNSKDFRVKCSDEAVGGSFTMDVSQRLPMLDMLLKANSLFVDLPTSAATSVHGSNSSRSADSFGPARRSRNGPSGRFSPYGTSVAGGNPVSKLFNLCKQRGWAPPNFKCEEYKADENTSNWGWKISLPKFGMELAVKDEFKHSNRTVAKNLAAENAFMIVSAMPAV